MVEKVSFQYLGEIKLEILKKFDEKSLAFQLQKCNQDCNFYLTMTFVGLIGIMASGFLLPSTSYSIFPLIMSLAISIVSSIGILKEKTIRGFIILNYQMLKKRGKK